jgi:hypothetical protein
MTSKEQRSPLEYPSDLSELLISADYFKREGADVSEGLAALEGQILAGLCGEPGQFDGTVPQALLSELGAEIFDTLLSKYLKWYRCSLIAVTQVAGQDHLAFAGYAQIERPHHLGLGVAYEMQTTAGANDGADTPLPKIGPVPGSVQVVIDASRPVRAAVAALKIEKTVNHKLEDPADIVRNTLQCRLESAYGYRGQISEVGLSIANELVGVTIWSGKAGSR